jgi:alpha-mannosidase
VQIGFASPIVAAREVNGAEEPVGPATLAGGKLTTSFGPFQPRTFAVKLATPAAKVPAVQSQAVKLSYDLAVASNDDTKSVGGFDAKGQTIPAEMLPATLNFSGVQFQLGPAKTGAPNAVVAKGQTIALPAGKFNRVYVLAASADGDQKATFRVGSQAVELTVQDWGGFIGQWYDRIWEATDTPIPARGNQPARTRHDQYGKMVGLRPAFVKSGAVAWFASHHHTAEGANVPYAYSYLFAYPIDVPAGAQSITLPNNDKIRVLAISTAEESMPLTAAAPLFDTLQY